MNEQEKAINALLSLAPDKFAGGLSRHTWAALISRGGMVVMEVAMRCAAVEFIQAVRGDGQELDYTNLANHTTDGMVFDDLAIPTGELAAEARSMTELLHTEYGVEAVELAIGWMCQRVAERLAELGWLNIPKINRRAAQVETARSHEQQGLPYNESDLFF